MPDLLHIVPRRNDAVLDGVFEREDTTLRLRLVTHVRVLLRHTHHHALLTRAAHDRRENSTRRVVAGESGLHHTGAIVAHERLRVLTLIAGFIGHDGRWVGAVR